MKLAEYLARRRRARVAAVMLFALIMGFVSAAPPVVTGCQAQDLTPAPDTSMLSPAVSALAQEQQEPAAQPLPEKWVCLTFDDGPSKTTPDVLSALNAAGVHATFFVVATGYNEKYLPLLTEAVSAGHQIALHSASHEYSDIYRSSDAYWADIALLKERIAPYVDAESIRYLRFPGGSTNTVSRRYGGKGLMKQLKAEVEQKGWHWVDWNVCAEDAVGGHPSAGTIYRNVVHETGQQTNCIVSDARFFLHTHHRRSTAGHHPVVCRQRLHLFDRCRGSAAKLSRLAQLQPVFKAAAKQDPCRCQCCQPEPVCSAGRYPACRQDGGKGAHRRQHDTRDAQQLFPPGRQPGVQLFRMNGVAADLVTVLARVAVGFVRESRPTKTPGTFPLWSRLSCIRVGLCIRLQGRRELLRRVDAALRDKGKVLLMLHLRQRAVILHPAGEKRSAAARGLPSGTGRRPHPVMPQTGPAGPVLHKNAPPLPAALRAVPVRSFAPAGHSPAMHRLQARIG